jgi:hypothetical protein
MPHHRGPLSAEGSPRLGVRPFYFDGCGFVPTDAGLIEL